MGQAWEPGDAGVLVLPSGRCVRGRALRRPPGHAPRPQFGLYLLGRPPEPMAWPSRWLRWPDMRLPSDHAAAQEALRDVWERAVDERVEVACPGGRGRTGTALACMAVLDGVPAEEAVHWVRRHWSPRAVETPWQRRYVARFRPPASPAGGGVSS